MICVTEAEIRVVDNPSLRRYELHLGGEVVGEIVYRRRADDVVAMLHAEVSPELEGRGLASKLAAGALDDARRRGLGIVPVCPFIDAFVRRHPEYADLVVPDPARRT